MPHASARTTTFSVSWTRVPVSPMTDEPRTGPAPCRTGAFEKPHFSGLHMSKKVLKKIVKSKPGQIVLGSIAAGAVGTVGFVMARRWVRTKLAERERRKIEAAAEKERQRVAAAAEKERLRLEAQAEQERQRAAARAEQERQRAAALAAQAQRKAERRAELESAVGTALNRAFARLGLNLRAEVAAANANAEPPVPASTTKSS